MPKFDREDDMVKWNEINGTPKPRRLKKFSEFARPKANDPGEPDQLDEGRKVINPNNREEIGIDKPHHPGQQIHAHLPNGRAVNKDGSLSHGGEPFTMKKSWADALRGQNFNIPKSRLIESEGGAVPILLDPELIELLLYLKAQLPDVEN